MATSQIVHVIDDDEAMRDSLSFLLDIQGFETRVYESATAFLDALPGLSGGCVLTDVRMPGLSGLELVDHLRAQGSEARCDICLTDEDGGLRATFVGVRTVLLPRR